MRTPQSTYAPVRASSPRPAKLEAELKKSGWRPAPTRCTTCGSDLTYGTDGSGNEIAWCATCQEGPRPLSRSSQRARETGALVSQGLVPALPTVRPGQLRCQRCACGVEGTKRFCVSCTADGLEMVLEVAR